MGPAAPASPTPGRPGATGTAAKTVEPSADADLASLLDEPAARRWYRRPLTWGLVVALLAAAGLGAWWWAGRAAQAAPVYNTQVVGRGKLTLTVTAMPARSAVRQSGMAGPRM